MLDRVDHSSLNLPALPQKYVFGRGKWGRKTRIDYLAKYSWISIRGKWRKVKEHVDRINIFKIFKPKSIIKVRKATKNGERAESFKLVELFKNIVKNIKSIMIIIVWSVHQLNYHQSIPYFLLRLTSFLTTFLYNLLQRFLLRSILS